MQEAMTFIEGELKSETRDQRIRLGAGIYDLDGMKVGDLPKRKLYLIGSLRESRIPVLAERLRMALPNFEVFDDWYAAGPEADDYWKAYETKREHSYQQALNGYAARHVFDFDKKHLDESSHVVLVLPAGKSGHMEAMYAKYKVGAKTAILLEPEWDGRFDVMYRFVDAVIESDDALLDWFKNGSPNLMGESING